MPTSSCVCLVVALRGPFAGVVASGMSCSASTAHTRSHTIRRARDARVPCATPSHDHGMDMGVARMGGAWWVVLALWTLRCKAWVERLSFVSCWVRPFAGGNSPLPRSSISNATHSCTILMYVIGTSSVTRRGSDEQLTNEQRGLSL